MQFCFMHSELNNIQNNRLCSSNKNTIKYLNLLLICVQIPMDRNIQRVRNGDMNPCIEVSLQSFTHNWKYLRPFFYPWFCTYLCRKPMPPRNVWMSTTMIKACVQSISSVIRTVGNTGWVFLDIFMFRFSNYNDKTVKNMLETNDHSFD